MVLTCKPYEIKNYGTAITHKHVKAVVLTYENSTLAEDYAAQTIFGGNAANGNLPISLAFKARRPAMTRATASTMTPTAWATPFLPRWDWTTA